MSITFDDGEKECLIRVEGDLDITCAEEMKEMLLQAMSSGKEIKVDLRNANEVDVSAVQLLWTVSREAQRVGTPFAVVEASESIRGAFRETGFEDFPWLGIPSSTLEGASKPSSEEPAR